jgi:hypothetical protein
MDPPRAGLRRASPMVLARFLRLLPLCALDRTGARAFPWNSPVCSAPEVELPMPGIAEIIDNRITAVARPPLRNMPAARRNAPRAGGAAT